MERKHNSDHSDTESRILAAAEKEFLTRGFAGARTTSIANAAGVNHAMLHYYFRTKERLFQRVIEEKITAVAKSITVKFEEADRPLSDCLREAITGHFDFVAANPELPRFMISDVMRDERLMGELSERIRTIASGVAARLQDKIDKEAAEGRCIKKRAIEIMMDIISLNIFAVVGVPVFQSVMGDEGAEGRSRILERRKEENIETILSKLQIRMK